MPNCRFIGIHDHALHTLLYRNLQVFQCNKNWCYDQKFHRLQEYLVHPIHYHERTQMDGSNNPITTMAFAGHRYFFQNPPPPPAHLQPQAATLTRWLSNQDCTDANISVLLGMLNTEYLRSLPGFDDARPHYAERLPRGNRYAWRRWVAYILEWQGRREFPGWVNQLLRVYIWPDPLDNRDGGLLREGVRLKSSVNGEPHGLPRGGDPLRSRTAAGVGSGAARGYRRGQRCQHGCDNSILNRLECLRPFLRGSSEKMKAAGMLLKSRLDFTRSGGQSSSSEGWKTPPEKANPLLQRSESPAGPADSAAASIDRSAE